MKGRNIYNLFEVVNDNTTSNDDFECYEVEFNAGRIFLCTLSGINWGNIKKPDDFEKPMEYAIRALDSLLTYQDYPLVEAELSTLEFRNLGIGINNLAYFLAKNNLKYNEDALEMIDEYMEAMSYYAIKASIQLAKEFGPCLQYKNTKWALGEFPWERRSKNIDDLVPFKLRKDWESLRKDLLTYGIRNVNLLANMPSESNSQLIGACNGIEPPQTLVSKKKSKDGILKLAVPDLIKLKNKYDLKWDQYGATGYLKVVGVLSKWIDQGTSVNTSYNPSHYGGTVPYDKIIDDIFLHYSLGGTTLYYNNILDGATDEYDFTAINKNTVDQKNKTTLVEESDADSLMNLSLSNECSACTL